MLGTFRDSPDDPQRVRRAAQGPEHPHLRLRRAGRARQRREPRDRPGRRPRLRPGGGPGGPRWRGDADGLDQVARADRSGRRLGAGGPRRRRRGGHGPPRGGRCRSPGSVASTASSRRRAPGAFGPLEASRIEDWDAHAPRPTSRATYLLCRAALPPMLAAGRGTIVAVVSLAAVRAIPGCAAYTASKAGVLGLVRALAAEVRGRGVRVARCLAGRCGHPLLGRDPEPAGPAPDAPARDGGRGGPPGRRPAARGVHRGDRPRPDTRGAMRSGRARGGPVSFAIMQCGTRDSCLTRARRIARGGPEWSR